MITRVRDHPHFVGRVEELNAIGSLLPRGLPGEGRLITLTGGMGIGKTRLLTEIATIALTHDLRVFRSFASEMTAPPPLYHWTLVLRALLHALSRDARETLLADCDPVLLPLLPELEVESGEKRTYGEAAADPLTGRYRLLQAITSLLFDAARSNPLLILLDNLHLADQSSLECLQYFADQLVDHPITIIAAYREDDQHWSNPVRRPLENIARLPHTYSLELKGLSREAVAQLMYGMLNGVAPEPIVDAIFYRSDGNPLYVTEVTRTLARQGDFTTVSVSSLVSRVPNSLRGVIFSRLDQLAKSTCHLLTIAAIFGREFDVASVAELADSRAEFIAEAFQQAEKQALLEALGSGLYRFAHVMYREVLYAEHDTLNRQALHLRAARYIESRYGADLEPQYPQLAHHFVEAARQDTTVEAVRYCRLAARGATDRQAHAEAVAHLQMALQAAKLNSIENPELRFELLSELGQAQYSAGSLSPCYRTLVEASLLAHRQSWWQALAGTLCYLQLVGQESGAQFPAAVDLHRAALTHLPDADRAMRARLLGSLARAYRLTGEPELAVRTYRQGVELARRCGQREVLVDCLRKGNWTVGRRPASLQEGLRICRQSERIAREINDQGALRAAIVDSIFQLCDLGEIDEVEQRLPLLEAELAQFRLPHYLNVLNGFKTALAILQGRWQVAVALAGEGARQIALQSVRGLEGRLGFQMFAINKALGNLHALAEPMAALLADDAGRTFWRPGQILLHCELRQYDEAMESLDRLGDLYSIADDDLRPISLVYLAEACVALEDQYRSEQLHRMLRPYRGLNATVPGTLMVGAMSGYLARLSVVLHRFVEAEELLREAIELNTAMGAQPALAQNLLDLSRLLMRTGKRSQVEESAVQMEFAKQIARNFNLRPLIHEIETSRSPTTDSTLTSRELDVLRLVAVGSSNKHIAGHLHISYSTVATHLRNILRKTGASNRTEAVEWARRSRLLDHG